MKENGIMSTLFTIVRYQRNIVFGKKDKLWMLDSLNVTKLEYDI
jgi:hypothetical protein